MKMICNKCKKEFKIKYFFKLINWIHYLERGYICSICKEVIIEKYKSLENNQTGDKNK